MCNLTLRMLTNCSPQYGHKTIFAEHGWPTSIICCSSFFVVQHLLLHTTQVFKSDCFDRTKEVLMVLNAVCVWCGLSFYFMEQSE